MNLKKGFFLSHVVTLCRVVVADPEFPRRGGGNFQGGDANLLFNQIFPENCMKMKEFGPRGGARVPGAPLDPPLCRLIDSRCL